MKNSVSLFDCRQKKFLSIKTFLIQAIISEQWLRFYYISELENGQLYIQITHDTLQFFQKKYPQLYPLIKKFNGIFVDANISYEKIHSISFEKYGSAIYNVMNSTSFQKLVTNFQQWVQEKTVFLEKTLFSFEDWIMFCKQDIPELQKVYS